MTVDIDDRRQHCGIIVAIVSGIGPVWTALEEPQNRRDRQCETTTAPIHLDDYSGGRNGAAIGLAGLLYATRELLYFFALMPRLGFIIALPALFAVAIIIIVRKQPLREQRDKNLLVVTAV